MKDGGRRMKDEGDGHRPVFEWFVSLESSVGDPRANVYGGLVNQHTLLSMTPRQCGWVCVGGGGF